MRVTVDCFRARVVDRFAAGFRAVPDRAATFGALFRFEPAAVFLALFAAVLVRAVARLDVVDLRRALLPDDFDPVAISIPRGRYAIAVRKIRAQ